MELCFFCFATSYSDTHNQEIVSVDGLYHKYLIVHQFMLLNNRKKRLLSLTILLIMVSSLVALCFKKFSENITFFVTPYQIYQRPEQYYNSNVRIGGMVVGNIIYQDHGEFFEFQLQEVKADKVYNIIVKYKGILPSLLQPGQMAVVKGKLRFSTAENEDVVIEASEVLAKHDENYRVPS